MTEFNVVYRATVFESKGKDASEATVLAPIAGAVHSDLFKVATREGIAGFKPYMGMPSGRRGRIDPLSKKTDTGEITFEVLDPRTAAGATNALRWVTAFIGDAKGLPRFARLKCFVEESFDGGVTWTPFFTGRVTGFSLKGGSRISYVMNVRDISGDLTYKIFTGLPHERVRATAIRSVTSPFTSTTLKDSGATWTVDQWIGAQVQLVGTGTGTGQVRTVISNTVDTLTVDAVWTATPDATSRYCIGYAQLVSVMPVGFVRSYGIAPVTTEINAKMGATHASGEWALLNVDSAHQSRIENILTTSLVSALGTGGFPGIPPASNPGTLTVAPTFSGIALARITRTDTGAEGDFLIGYGSTVTTTNINVLSRFHIGITKTVWSLAAKPVAYPLGVATGAPQANGATAASPTSATQAVPVKGWTISITGIVKAGDILSFSGHLQRYMVQADANSDGSGNVTITLSPGLQSAVVNSEVITVQRSPGKMALPATNVAIKFHVFCDMQLADGQIEGKPGNIMLLNDIHPARALQDAVQGMYGYIYRPTYTADGSGNLAVPLPPGKNLGDPITAIPVQLTDAAGDARHGFNALLADKTFPPFRCVVDKSMNIRDFIEQYICKPYGIGYYFDGSGNFVPVDMRQPAAIPAGIADVTDADLIDEKPPGWSYDPNAAVTRGEYTVYGEAIVQPISMRLEVGDQFPKITSKMFDVAGAKIADGTLGNLSLSDKSYAVDYKGYRAMPGETYAWMNNGQPMTGSRFQFVSQRAFEMAHAAVARPYGNGATTVSLTVARNANTAIIFPGSFFKLNIASNPDPASNTRGPERLMLCLERAEDGPTAKLTAVDWSLTTVSNAPTLGVPAQLTGDTSHSCTCAVTLNVPGGSDLPEPAEVWINVTDTSVGARPADSHPGWFWLATNYVNWTATARALPAGKRVWWRGRTMPQRFAHVLGPEHRTSGTKFPSVWAYGTGSVDLAVLSAPTGLASSAITRTSFRVSWANPDATRQVEVWIATPTTDTRTFVALLPPGSTQFDFTGLSASTTYRVGVRTVDGVGGFAEATLDVATTALVPTIQPPFNTRGTKLMV